MQAVSPGQKYRREQWSGKRFYRIQIGLIFKTHKSVESPGYFNILI